MPLNGADFFGFRADHLQAFCQLVMRTKQTPELISLVAGDFEYVEYCRKIINTDEKNRRMFFLFCRCCGYDPDEILKRVSLVATVLGMHKQADSYGILGVTPDADDAAIKQAFRKKAKLLHPDKQYEEKDSNAFIELHAAYSHLSDPDSRESNNSTEKDVGPWIEGDRLCTSPNRPAAAGRFIRQMCILIGAVATIVYVFDVFQIQQDLFPVRQHLSTPLDASSAPASVSLEEQARSDLTVPPTDEITAKNTELKEYRSNHVFMELNYTSDDHSPGAEQDNDPYGTELTDERLDLPNEGGLAKEGPVFEPEVKNASFSGNNKAGTVENTREKTSFSRRSEKIQEIAKLSISKANIPPVADPGVVAEEKKDDAVQSGSKGKWLDVKDAYLFQKQRVLKFLRLYSKTYEQKNLMQFKTFFTKDALEQGRPFKTLLPTYQQTFDKFKGLEYQIKLTKLSMEKGGGKIFVESNFTLFYELPENVWDSRTGLLRMELLDSPDRLLVSRMDYEFGN